jgi:hypothetical protein
MAQIGVNALRHEQLPRPKQHRQRRLLLAPHGYKAHRGLQGGFGDGFGIGRIIPMTLQEGLQVGRRNQPDGVAQPRDLPSPAMSHGTGLHGYDTVRLLAQERQELRVGQLFAEDCGSIRPGAMQLNTRLARSRPMMVRSEMDVSSWNAFTRNHSGISRCCQGEGIHAIIVAPKTRICSFESGANFMLRFWYRASSNSRLGHLQRKRALICALDIAFSCVCVNAAT